jgi:2EXR family
VETQLQQILKDRQFTCFDSLPTELRLRIWEFAFASHTQPRIHCVDMSKSNGDREGTFISNHPISPILHTNHESRSHYLLKTQLMFAFETYINFDTDIVYIPDFADREFHFRKFLDFEDSRKIQRLALRKNFFCDIPLPGHFSSSHLEMMDCLWDWNQMIIIFEDERLGEEVWKDTTVVFREFSAREKRKKAERNYVRKYSRVLNGMLEGIEEETMDFRFGRIERSAGHDSSIGALCSSRDEDMEDMKWLRHFSRNHGPSWRVANFGVGSL